MRPLSPAVLRASLARLVVLGAGVSASACDGHTATPSGAGTTAGATSSSTGSDTGGTGGGGAVGATSTSSGAGGGAGGEAAPSIDCSASVGAAVPLRLTPIATGLTSPVLVKPAPGDPHRLYVVEKVGRVRVIIDGALLPTPFLDITALVDTSHIERGALGLAFHPDYPQNGRLFIHYTALGTGATVIAEYARSINPDVASPEPVAQVLTVPQPEPNHNGGSIEFGPDGMLYIALGDGGSGGDPHGPIGNAQNTGTLLGKILRIDATTLPYTIPPGNMEGPGVLPELWDYGLRNPWRISFDACTGDLYIGDVGQETWEEVDVEPAGQGHRNYGWRFMEGDGCYNPGANCNPNNDLTLPTLEYHHSVGCSVIGGYVYRGGAIPSLRGSYLYGDYCSGHINAFDWIGGAAVNQRDLTDDLQSAGLSITSFGQDLAGEVYVVDDGGGVRRIDSE